MGDNHLDMAKLGSSYIFDIVCLAAVDSGWTALFRNVLFFMLNVYLLWCYMVCVFAIEALVQPIFIFVQNIIWRTRGKRLWQNTYSLKVWILHGKKSTENILYWGFSSVIPLMLPGEWLKQTCSGPLVTDQVCVTDERSCALWGIAGLLVKYPLLCLWCNFFKITLSGYFIL